MARFNWKELLAHEGDEVLTFLHRLEDGFIRAINGIWVFVWKKIPELVRGFVVWLQEKSIYACRIAVRLGRVAALFLAWALVVFAPIGVYPGIITGLWTALAIFGSWWGVQREIKKHQRVWTN